MWPYRRGYTGFNYHVTGEHEKEAEEAERAKVPGRLAVLVVRLLGLRRYRRPPPVVRHASPSHEHRHRAP